MEDSQPRAISQDDWTTANCSTDGEINTRSLAQTLLWTITTLYSPSLTAGHKRFEFLNGAFEWFLRAGWKGYRARIVRSMEFEWGTPSPVSSMLESAALRRLSDELSIVAKDIAIAFSKDEDRRSREATSPWRDGAETVRGADAPDECLLDSEFVIVRRPTL
ncbi:unnamed protein product [Peniophora sp. CBMAI 1063]|nr:unnamed protein product [Peniophora sp. CBMAI 1063]